MNHPALLGTLSQLVADVFGNLWHGLAGGVLQ